MSENSRLRRLRRVMARQAVDLLLLWPSANWRYLLGHAPIAVERPTFLMVTRERVCAVVPVFDHEELVAQTGLRDVFSWSDAEGPRAAIESAWQRIDGAAARVIAIDDTLPFGYLKALGGHIDPAVATRTAAALMATLRQIKSPEEIAAVRRTAALIEGVLAQAAAIFTPGITEKRAELRLKARLLEAGAETLDFVLVQAPPNSAAAHHLPGATLITEGNPVLLDIAVSAGGYYADITRQVCIGEPAEKYREVYRIVHRAQAAAVAAVRPGRTVGEIDRAARGIISDAGMGPFFTTRTGHGLGLEVHEPPAVCGDNELPLEPGMVFTIEPGIYLPGEFGIRIEDTVAVTERGAERLTRMAREVLVL